MLCRIKCKKYDFKYNIEFWREWNSIVLSYRELMSTFCLATLPLPASTQAQKFSCTLFPYAFLCRLSPVEIAILSEEVLIVWQVCAEANLHVPERSLVYVLQQGFR